MDKDLFVNYSAVLADQEAKRERLLSEVSLIDAFIVSLKVTLGALKPEPQPAPKATAPVPATPGAAVPPPGQTIPEHLIYAGISVRWAVLCLLAEHVTEPQTTGEMATALVAGGVRSSGQNFTANVSAVVSDMARKRLELSVEDGKYQITPLGKEVWSSIKRSRPYRFRRLGVAAPQ